jgi:cytochrome c biogenesis protein CcmG, thiol:disulfide interchange protein DsbE
MLRLALVLAGAILAIAACDSGEEPRSAASPGDAQRLAGAPPPLAALHRQGNELLDGGADAFKARLRRLRGYPVVVNKWASWCGPCRFEFPFFQRLSVKHGKRVAFLGVDSDDSDGDAREFLRKFPVPFPSYKDPHLAVAAELGAVQATPATAFYDAKGELAFLHQGGYASEAKLAEDIDRYAR